MTNIAKIKDVFTSIQGEGPFVGFRQLFIRFCGCNLICKYCDTDYRTVESLEYSAEDLANIVKLHTECHSVSLTHTVEQEHYF